MENGTKNKISSANNNPTKSWIDLKWNNPENNLNRTSPTKSRRPRTLKICKKCGQSNQTGTCSTCQKIDLCRIYRQTKLPITKHGKDGVQSGAVQMSPIIGGTGSPSRVRRLQKEHWWRCDGPCQHQMPFFGLVRRAINREPGPKDKWWASHAGTCGGTFSKVKEPSENKSEVDGLRNGDIRNFLSPSKSGLESCTSSVGGSGSSSVEVAGASTSSNVDLLLEESQFEGSKNHLDTSSVRDSRICSSEVAATSTRTGDDNASNNETAGEIEDFLRASPLTEDLKECSICNKKVESSNFEAHEDECLVDSCENIEELRENVSCLSCGSDIPKSELNSHFENCLSDIFEEDVFETKEEEIPKFNCPLCMTLVPENVIKAHIDICLNTSNDPAIELLTSQ